jgi:NADH:ubiquinone oxidoreductase subunit E
MTLGVIFNVANTWSESIDWWRHNYLIRNQTLLTNLPKIQEIILWVTKHRLQHKTHGIIYFQKYRKAILESM